MLAPKRVLVDVDVQVDFCEPEGALAVPGSPNEVFRDLVRFALGNDIRIVGSVDSHAWDAWEFASNDRRGPDGEKPNFPDHCVKGTSGWLKVRGTLPERFRFLPNVKEAPSNNILFELVRGQTQAVYFEKEVYSLFANPSADKFLAAFARAMGAGTEMVVFGVATDYCVKEAALGLVERGYRTIVLTDAIAGISPTGAAAALEEMKAAGVELSTAAELMRG